MSENEKDQFQLKRFGRYLILDHLVDGGMAKIYRARFLGEKADKIVAIKMVQPQYSKDKNFQEMFDLELKLAFALHHPNICQTYDYGKYKGIWYTAMEYIDGKNLKQILDRLKKRNEPFPIHLATFVISQVCQGLYYAHTFTEKLTGDHYKIVHRDISPHNVMITYDGAVKVIDFGIAKTEMGQDATQAGTIKGKLSYLAPEYLEGKELDQRYDMFAVGITLWEMLCGRKLFVGTNDINIINEIRECKIVAPSSINPTVPKELDYITLKALSKDRDLRYRDMNAMCKALLKFLYTHYPDFNPLDISDFTRDIFSEEIKRDREKLREYGRMDIGPFINELVNEMQVDNTKVGTGKVDPETVEKLISEKKNIQLDLTPDSTKSMQHSSGMPGHMKGMPPQVGVNGKPIRRYTLDGEDTLTGIRKQYGKHKVATKGPSSSLASFITVLLVACAIILFVYKDDPKYKSQIRQILGSVFPGYGSSEPNSENIDRRTAAEDNKSKKIEGTLYFENYSPNMLIKINNELAIYSPLGIKVPLNKDLQISVSLSNGNRFERTIKLTETEDSKRVQIPANEESKEGFLTITKSYRAGSKLVYYYNRQKIEVDLPVKNYRMPAGSHNAVVIDADQNIIDKFKLEIEENKSHVLGNF